jgi:glycerophosphoryl diester phosphodiesterase
MNNPCAAHRGWSSKAPENTLAAFQKAIEQPHIDMIELDVQLSRDGVPVVIHDFTLERTTNGSGYVGDYTLKELKQLDAGSWYAEAFAGETIPTLEEVLQLVQGKKTLNIELKCAGNWYPGIEKKVIELIRQYGMESSVVITSFHHANIREVSRLAPELKKGLLIDGMPLLLDEQLEVTGATVLSMYYPFLTESFVRSYRERGIEFIAWTIDQPEEMKRVAALDEGIVICTNDPERYLVLREYTERT